MTPVLVLGDSHASVFSSDEMRTLLSEYSFEVISVGGATVSGLKNPNAVTQAMPQFTAALDATHAKTVIVMLGEVDTGFVIWYRAQKHDSSVEQMLQLALDNYQKLLKDIARTHQVIALSTPLPTIQDEMEWGEVANLRKEVKASLADRTRLTIEFNNRMEEFCRRERFSYLNLDSHSIDASGRLKESLRNPDPSDHHYDPSAHALMIAPCLAPVLEHCRRMEHEGIDSLDANAADRPDRCNLLSRLWRAMSSKK
ncbi:SGNH/GDSL hydrolase family protein [Pseudomonas sp. 58(2021)]|uniref:SGNH/GDSL hydrolase family protein n=1 Tax=Pseudomonas sp. 58(2021) TaxID=2813330 RepID=UPI001A9D0C21|nr:SGNH/GDSL hydrolase family protein [Pseudomonas sp. 58(2021)]